MNLYNGNISAMMTHLGAEHFPTDMSDAVPGMLGMAYRYDQLNRITEAKGFTNFTASGWQAENQNPIYGTRYTYDANGNLLTLKRHDAGGTLFDDFTYRYNGSFEGAIHKPVSNRLYHVNDGVPNSPMEGDIEDQGPFTADVELINTDNNYSYSALGELVRDAAEGIDEIVWRVDGKIAEIRRSADGGKHLKFSYDAHGNRIAKHIFSPTNTWEASTYYVRDAQGNVMATYLHTTEEGEYDGQPLTLATYTVSERHINGSSRLGMDTTRIELLAYEPPPADHVYTTNADDRIYELTNHLGNLLATFTARKLPITDNGEVTGFMAHVSSLSDYYPFGSALTGRMVDQDYRYGFNTQEKDDEIYGSGNSYTAEFWQYDSRLARRWNLDPKPNPEYSRYSVFQLNPLFYTDILGDTVRIAEGESPEFERQVHLAIDELLDTERGLQLWLELDRSDQVFEIREFNSSMDGGNDKSFFRANFIEIVDNETGVTSVQANGGVIVWSVSGQMIPVEGKFVPGPSVMALSGKFALFHEMLHAEDQAKGDLYSMMSKSTRGLENHEWSATFGENQIRAEMGASLRMYYRATADGKGLPPALLRYTAKGVESKYKQGYIFRQ